MESLSLSLSLVIAIDEERADREKWYHAYSVSHLNTILYAIDSVFPVLDGFLKSWTC